MPRKPNTTKDGYNDPFPTALRNLMNERKVTQDTIAQVLGLKNRQSVTGYVDGSTLPTIDKVVALAKFFSVSADYLLGLSTIKTVDTSRRAVCDYLGVSEAAINNMKRIAEMPRRADMRVSGIFALDLLLRASSLDGLCMALSQNLLASAKPLPVEFDTYETFTALAELESSLSNMYGGADFYIVCGSRAEDERKKNLNEAMRTVCYDALHPQPDVTQQVTTAQYDNAFDDLYARIDAEIAEGEENA